MAYVLLVLLVQTLWRAGWATPASTKQADLCLQPDSPFQALYDNIDTHLRHWAKAQDGGVQSELVDAAIHAEDSRWQWRRVAVLIEDGVPYLISDPEWPVGAGHHRHLAAAHLMLILALCRRYGTALPDTEFVIGTSDQPTVRLDRTPPGQRPIPIFRFCSTIHHADILVPDIHFHTRAFTERVLSLAAPTANTTQEDSLPAWSDRKARLFGRFSPYHRLHNPGDVATERKGFRGAEICEQPQGSETSFCPVRTMMMEWAARKVVHSGVRMDIAQQPRRSMPDHAKYKYLLHLDGQTCSSRLEQLLALGSLTIKEESGYVAFFHHLLEPYKHYVPFYVRAPEELTEAVDWALTHDQQASQIASAGQQLALQYLNKQALSCYWLRMIRSYTALLRYTPGIKGGRHYKHRMPIEQWLQKGPGRSIVRKYRVTVEV